MFYSCFYTKYTENVVFVFVASWQGKKQKSVDVLSKLQVPMCRHFGFKSAKESTNKNKVEYTICKLKMIYKTEMAH